MTGNPNSPFYRVREAKRTPDRAHWFMKALAYYGPAKRGIAWQRAGGLRGEGFGNDKAKKYAVAHLLKTGQIEELPNRSLRIKI